MLSVKLGVRLQPHTFFMLWDPRVWHPLQGCEGYSFTPGEVPRKDIPVSGMGLQSMAPSADAAHIPLPRQQTLAPPPHIFGDSKS